MKVLRTLLILGRVSNLPTVWTNVLAGWFLARGTFSPDLIWLLVGISLLYIAGMTFNDVFDAKWDSEHAPERPIPSGAISRKFAGSCGIIQLLTGFALILVPSSSLWLPAASLVAAIFFYNWLHKRWAGSVLIMGICRGLVYALAFTAAGTDSTKFAAPFLAFTMIGYVAGITLAARFERSRDTNRAPVLFAQVLLFTPVLGFVALHDQTPYWPWILAGGLLTWLSWLFFSMRALKNSIPTGVALLIAGICVIDAVAIAFGDLKIAILALAMLPLTLLFQRFIPAT
ncbi:MAG: UbiA family prenyltransferase [Verrucomicrobiales bacterium]|nr:UbiA family prenyltransferase [Verrucomicrobiales bacterium]